MLSVFFIFPVRAKNTFGKKKDKVTRLHFYDLNKNGRMDTYENPSALSFVTDDFGGKGRTDAYFIGVAHVRTGGRGHPPDPSVGERNRRVPYRIALGFYAG